jgi:hypothetical protein
MGLLDDAIRQHLELKRQHGAAEDEVAQLEQEAFGPARRGPEPLEVPPATEAAAATEDPVLMEPEVDAPPVAPADPDLADLPDLDAPDPPLPVESEAVEPASEPPLQETTAFSPEEVAEAQGRSAPPPAPAEDEEAADVLEETPEFLEETPEHDRLWFEQRPPRDFDFDG